MKTPNRLDWSGLAVRFRTRAVALVVLGLVVVLLSGCLAVQRNGDGTLEIVKVPPGGLQQAKNSKTAEKPPAKDAEHPEEDAPAPIGTPFQTGKWEVTITSVKPHKKMSDGKKPKKGNVLIYVNVKIRNIGSGAALKVKPSQFGMYDAGRKKVKPFKTKFVAFNAKQVRPIEVGLGGHTTFVYQVPKGSTGYTFWWKKTKASETTYRWAIW